MDPGRARMISEEKVSVGDTKTEDLLDQLAVRSTLEAYFSSVDRRDWVAYGNCFTADARFDLMHDKPESVVGREAIVKRAEQRTNRPTSTHYLSNAHILVSGKCATAKTHAVAHLVVPGDSGKRIVVRGIVYDDELVEVGERHWQIARRVHAPLWQFEALSMPLGY